MKRNLAVVFVLIFALALGATAASAASVEPRFVDGNPTCADFGSFFEIKHDSGLSGTASDGVNSVIVTVNGSADEGTLSISFSSTVSLDLVIVKASNSANVYDYRPGESSSDSGLITPTNPANNKPYDLSHITFCYDVELGVSKTANTEYIRTYSWTIDKSVDDNSHTGFAGDPFQSNYDVFVDQTVTDSAHRIFGNITITNPAPVSVNMSVADSIDGIGPVGTDCPASIGAGSTVVCSYSVNSQVGTVNTVIVTSTTTGVSGGQATAGIVWGDPTTTVGYPTVNVTDIPQGPLGTASADKLIEYSRNFACPTDITEYTNGVYTENFPNTATIVETGASGDALVSLTCYVPVASKDASTSYDRDWTWTIEKTGSETDLTLSTGQIWTVNYTVTASAIYDDSNFVVSGSISVQNPNPSQSMTVSVSDMVGAVPAVVDCGGGFSTLTVAPGGTDACSYTADLGDDDKPADGVNTAFVTLQNGNSFPAIAPYSFGTPANETDDCAVVTDTYPGGPQDQQVCADEGSKTFTYTYSRDLSYDVCGPYTEPNTATVTTTDIGEIDDASWTVNVDVPCAVGCTLTQGYWRTHSTYGPAPYDDTWALQGEDTQFFGNVGVSWYQILWMQVSGDPYLILAKQYIAATLNGLNGASTFTVDAALDQAEALLGQYNLGTVPANKRGQFTSLAGTLDAYNNGLNGPVHCSE